ncbi:MAG: MerR family transcriptional regulator [Devosiaceae bacterium]|nr:MerR family transcriptional regulator [Devosiaceae bacterium MH13]
MARASTKSPEAFRTISEAAEALDLPQHVLRFWETRFSQIKPMKRSGGRRYYRPSDIALLSGIRHLLYDEGYTIKGVQRILREQGVAHVSDQSTLSGTPGQGQVAQPVPAPAQAEPPLPSPSPVQPDSVAEPAPAPASVAPAQPVAPQPVALQPVAQAPAPAPAPAAPPEVPATIAAGADRSSRLSHADINALATALRDLIECKVILDDARSGNRPEASTQPLTAQAG